jgi:hypothetical protein
MTTCQGRTVTVKSPSATLASSWVASCVARSTWFGARQPEDCHALAVAVSERSGCDQVAGPAHPGEERDVPGEPGVIEHRLSGWCRRAWPVQERYPGLAVLPPGVVAVAVQDRGPALVVLGAGGGRIVEGIPSGVLEYDPGRKPGAPAEGTGNAQPDQDIDDELLPGSRSR